MSRKSIIAIIVVGVADILLVYPLLFSAYLYEAKNNPGSWLTDLGNAYRIIFSFQDWKPLFVGVLFGLLGITFIMKAMVGNKKFRCIVALQNRTRAIDLIQKGENSYIAFQPRLRQDLEHPEPSEAWELIVARIMAGLMNTHGGHLFIGLNRGGEFSGLEEDYQILKKSNRQLPIRESFHRYIMQVVANILEADCCPLVKVDFYEINGKDICHIRIRRSASPVYVHIGDRAHFFIRSGKATLELGVREVLDHIENLSG